MSKLIIKFIPFLLKFIIAAFEKQAAHEESKASVARKSASAIMSDARRSSNQMMGDARAADLKAKKLKEQHAAINTISL